MKPLFSLIFAMIGIMALTVLKDLAIAIFVFAFALMILIDWIFNGNAGMEV